MTSVRRIDAEALHAALIDAAQGRRELAPVDVREEGVFGAGHLLRAANVPLSRLELDIRRLVPRPTTPVVLMDDADGLAERAAAVMATAGYTDIAVLEGGVAAWRAAGGELFSGLNVPSKAFGEHVEHRDGTPNLAAEELKARMDSGEDMVILDSRPMSEFRAMNIPGGVDVPGAELVHRVRALAPDPATTVVVNCAGRTRSIIGAQSLINAGLDNPVYALKNGTMGWHLAGYGLERGAERAAPEPDAGARRWAEDAAARVAARFGVREVDAATLAEMRADTGRTTYLLDVRGPDEYAAGHLPGAAHAPGGQLVQATDRYVATLGARLVLVDDTGVRARMTASWLVQMGWPEVYVLADGLDAAATLDHGAESPDVPELAAADPAWITPDALAAAPDVPVVDLSRSLDHKAGHVPGARFAIRARLAADLGAPPAGLVLTARDERLARLAAADLARAGHGDVRVLAGGFPAWRAAGHPVETGMTAPLSDPAADVYARPYDLDEGVEAAMQAYLDWEVALVDRVARDGTLVFPDFGS